ncbi:MAG: lectin-like protein [Polyangiales bacterium]
MRGGDNRWIGANDVDNERNGNTTQWRFTSGTSNSGGGIAPSNLWNSGEPNNTGTVGCLIQGEDCVEITSGGGWNDIPCFCTFNAASASRGYICEGNALCGNGVHASTEGCDDGNTASNDGCSATCQPEAGYTCVGTPSRCFQTARYNGREYRLYRGVSLTWANAEAQCVSGGGHLARINDIDEQEYVFARTGDVSTWIGANRVGSNWEWSDNGDAFYNHTTDVSERFSHWVEPGEPSGNGNCGYIWAGHFGRWDDVGCGTLLPFVCEQAFACSATCGDNILCRTAGETCDDGNTASNDGCSSTCRAERGYYCPAGDGVTSGNGFCQNACPSPVSYSRFPLTPAQLAGEQADQTSSGAQPDAASAEYAYCGTARGAYQAQRVCESFGPNWSLVRVNSQFENSMIGGFATATAWIGATDVEDGVSGSNEQEPPYNGTFRWQDGVTFGGTLPDTVGGGAPVSPWGGIEPNNAGFGEDCVTSSTGGVWNDLRCGESAAYTCEGPAVCGNGAVAMPEECDKGALNGTGVGCTSACEISSGFGCLLPGGVSDPADAPGFVATCPRSASGSCCFLNAQAVVSGVRVVGGELEWTTAGEAGTLGFYVSVQQGDDWRDVHEGILPALPDAAQGAVYRLRATGLRGRTVRIVEHELGGRSLTVYEGQPAYEGGASTLTGTNFSVTARPLTGAPDMSPDAAPSPGARRKAAGDTPTGVFALAASEGLTRVTFAEIAAELRVPVSVVESSVASGALSISDHGMPVAWVGGADAIVFNARRRTSVYGGTRPYELRLSAGVELVEVDRSLPDVATGVGQQRAFREVDTFPALAVSPDPTQEFWFEAALGNHNSFRDYNASVVLSNVDGGPATFDLGIYGAPGLSTEAPLTLTLTLNGQTIEAHDVTTTGLSVVSFAILPAAAKRTLSSAPTPCACAPRRLRRPARRSCTSTATRSPTARRWSSWTRAASWRVRTAPSRSSWTWLRARTCTCWTRRSTAWFARPARTSTPPARASPSTRRPVTSTSWPPRRGCTHRPGCVPGPSRTSPTRAATPSTSSSPRRRCTTRRRRWLRAGRRRG